MLHWCKVEKNKQKKKTKNNFILSRFWIILESVLWITIYCLVTETKGQTRRSVKFLAFIQPVLQWIMHTTGNEVQGFHYY